MKAIQTTLPGVIIFEPHVYGDKRGFFLESFRSDILGATGITDTFVQDNHSRSKKGVLRGLHYQIKNPQGKLVRVSNGRVFDVAVDIRIGSPTFGRWHGTILDDESMRLMYIPPNFAHGFIVLSETADFLYKCTEYYHPESEQGILWNDPDIGINWPDIKASLSDKDLHNPLLKDQKVEYLPTYQKTV